MKYFHTTMTMKMTMTEHNSVLKFVQLPQVIHNRIQQFWFGFVLITTNWIRLSVGALALPCCDRNTNECSMAISSQVRMRWGELLWKLLNKYTMCYVQCSAMQCSMQYSMQCTVPCAPRVVHSARCSCEWINGIILFNPKYNWYAWLCLSNFRL